MLLLLSKCFLERSLNIQGQQPHMSPCACMSCPASRRTGIRNKGIRGNYKNGEDRALFLRRSGMREVTAVAVVVMPVYAY